VPDVLMLQRPTKASHVFFAGTKRSASTALLTGPARVAEGGNAHKRRISLPASAFGGGASRAKAENGGGMNECVCACV
jgi:hypothetical protein